MDSTLPQSFYGSSISSNVCKPNLPIINNQTKCNLKTCANPFQPFNGGTSEFSVNNLLITDPLLRLYARVNTLDQSQINLYCKNYRQNQI
jgi:hypothetical protein